MAAIHHCPQVAGPFFLEKIACGATVAKPASEAIPAAIQGCSLAHPPKSVTLRTSSSIACRLLTITAFAQASSWLRNTASENTETASGSGGDSLGDVLPDGLSLLVASSLILLLSPT